MSLRDFRYPYCDVAVYIMRVHEHFYWAGSVFGTMGDETRQMAEAVSPEKPAEAGSALLGGTETWG
jgi:hypothetical protein